MSRVFIHIVTFQDCSNLVTVLNSLTSQVGFNLNHNLEIHITDNGNNSGGVPQLPAGIIHKQNPANLGFSGAQNQGIGTFLSGNVDYFLCLNPDCCLAPGAIAALIQGLEAHPEAGFATPKLLRADQLLAPIVPATLDAAGMTLNHDLRHLDRGSGEKDSGQFETPELVFGGTGACLLMRREAILKLLLPRTSHDSALWNIYPQLQPGAATRPQLFDEAFFAYREDADLAWRGNRSGINTIYVPSAIGYHERQVVPERRRECSPMINMFGVRNRFLLQLNNFSPTENLRMTVQGMIVRNVVVIIATLLIERSSIVGLWQVVLLARRALEQRKALERKLRGSLEQF